MATCAWRQKPGMYSHLTYSSPRLRYEPSFWHVSRKRPHLVFGSDRGVPGHHADDNAKCRQPFILFSLLLANGALLAPCRRWIGKCKCARN